MSSRGRWPADGSSFAWSVLWLGSVDVGGVVDDYLSLEFDINLAAVGVDYELETSGDLVDWAPVGGEFTHVSTTNNGDGTATVQYRSTAPFDPAGRRDFYRLRVSG